MAQAYSLAGGGARRIHGLSEARGVSGPAKVLVRLACGVRNRVRRHGIRLLTAPRRLAIPGSRLSFYIHSTVEQARVSAPREPWTVAWLRALPGGAVLYDIGANIGVTALLAAEDDKRKVTVVAIEPFPANFASLVKNAALNRLADRVIALPLGLGARTELGTFHWANAEPGGALHSFGVIVEPRTGASMPAIARHHCPCFRLEDLVALPGLPFPTHLKIDVDGGELDVLSGARAVLRDTRCVGVQIEVTDDKRGRRHAVIEEFCAAGFRLILEHPHAGGRVADLQFSKAA